MGEYDSPARHLPFPLDQSSEIQRTTEDDVECETTSSFVWPEDPEERTLVPFYLSLNEYIVLSSAVDAGSDIAYSDDAIRVWWLWTRNMRCEVDLCALIADCITNSPATRQAIINLVTSDPTIRDYVEGVATEVGLSILERNTNILKPDQCDPDYVFNQASQLVFLLDQLVEDLFQAIEVGTNALERGEILASILGTGAYGAIAASLLSLAEQIVEEIKEDYQATYGQDLYDELRCGLFCKAKDSCILSIDDAFAYYQEKAELSIPSNPEQALEFMLEYMATASFPGDTIVYAMQLFIISLIRTGQQFLGVDFTKLAMRITAAGDEPDNDWEVLCEICAEGEICDDLTESEAGWFGFGANAGVYHDAASGNAGFGPSVSTARINIEKEDLDSVKHIKITLRYEAAAPIQLNRVVAGVHYKIMDISLSSQIGEFFIYEADVPDYEGSLSISVILSGATNPNIRVKRICYEFDPAIIDLVPYLEEYTLTFEGNSGTDSIYLFEAKVTGNYLMGGGYSPTLVTFNVVDKEIVSGTIWNAGPKIGIGVGGLTGSYSFDDLPDNADSTVIQLLNVNAGDKIRLTLRPT